jgi:hypothetical protein
MNFQSGNPSVPCKTARVDPVEHRFLTAKNSRGIRRPLPIFCGTRVPSPIPVRIPYGVKSTTRELTDRVFQPVHIAFSLVAGVLNMQGFQKFRRTLAATGKGCRPQELHTVCVTLHMEGRKLEHVGVPHFSQLQPHRRTMEEI